MENTMSQLAPVESIWIPVNYLARVLRDMCDPMVTSSFLAS
jgi:hypothetical protein